MSLTTHEHQHGDYRRPMCPKCFGEVSACSRDRYDHWCCDDCGRVWRHE